MAKLLNIILVTFVVFKVVLSRHIPDENDPLFFEKLVELTSPGFTPVKPDCIEPGINERRFSGEEWYERGGCIQKTCNAGVIESRVVCNQVCNIGGKEYYTGENFTRPDSPCEIFECVYDRPFGAFKENVQCEQKLDCDKNGKVKLQTECCEKCRSDVCTKENTAYEKNCHRKCGDKQCAIKTFGCYCKTGYVLDENDKCIKESDCTCKVDSKVYQPKEECTCLRGLLQCKMSQS